MADWKRLLKNRVQLRISLVEIDLNGTLPKRNSMLSPFFRLPNESFVAQGDDRVDPQGAAGGQVAG